MENKIKLPEKAWVYLPVGFAAGLILGVLIGALLSPHHNNLEFRMFSGNGCGNKGKNVVRKPEKQRKKY